MNIFGKKPAETIVISVGGSLIAPNGGIDVDFLKKFKLFISKQVKEHNRRFLLVIGGGKASRAYRDAAKNVIGSITSEDLDWIGIHTTRLNAHLFRTIFTDIAHPIIIENYEKLVGKEWKPGINAPFDPVASQLAKKIGTMVIVANGKNLSNLNRILDGESFKGTVITNFTIDATFYDREYFEEQKGEYPLPLTYSVIGKFIQDVANFYRAFWIKVFINPKNCLDIGCGTGKLVYQLRRLGVEAYGIEISEYAISAADKEIQPFLQYADATKIPFKDDSFDLVVSFDVMEHMERPKIKKSIKKSIRESRKLILHKIYTIENDWIRWTHKQDFSHISLMSQAFWFDLFRSIDNVSIVKKFVFKLPAFFESLFLLRKKTT